jgi:ABC-type uncharacterized transport system ATPase subunit
MVKELAIRTCELTKQFERQFAVNHVDLEILQSKVYGLIGLCRENYLIPLLLLQEKQN